MRNDVAYHMENADFVAFLEAHAQKLSVEVADDTIADVDQDDRGITALVGRSGQRHAADLYVDSSGFVSALLGKALNEPFITFKTSLFCDRAVVGGWDRGEEAIKPYTTCETMDAGWCWQIEHEHRINRGYVYCSAFLSDDDAEREFHQKNPKVGPTRVVRFISGRYERAWVQNVVAIGNAAGFVEPLESTSLGVICDQSDSLVNSLIECDRRPTPTIVGQYNKRFRLKWDNIRDFLGIHYKFNTGMDTPYWRECREKCDIAGAAELVEYYRENGPGTYHHHTLLNRLSQFGLEGYWALLIGQKVPYERPYVPSERERQTWRQIQEAFKAKALTAVGVKEALTLVRSQDFHWPPTLYSDKLFEMSF